MIKKLTAIERSMAKRRIILFSAVLCVFAVAIGLFAIKKASATYITSGDPSNYLIVNRAELEAELEKQTDEIDNCMMIWGTSDIATKNLETRALLDLTYQLAGTRSTDYDLRISEIKRFGTLAENVIYGVNGRTSFASIAMNITKPLAMILILSYAAFSLIQMIAKDRASVESWIRLFICTTIGFLIMAFSDTILNAIEGLGMQLYSEANTKLLNWRYNMYLELKGGASAPISVYGNDRPIIDFSGAISDAIVWIFTITTYASIIAGAYSILFEHAIRRILMPLSLASISADGIEGRRSAGFKYITSYAGMYLRMISYSLIVLVFSILTTYARHDLLFNIQGWDFMNVLMIIAIRVATQGAITTSSSVIREAVG